MDFNKANVIKRVKGPALLVALQEQKVAQEFGFDQEHESDWVFGPRFQALVIERQYLGNLGLFVKISVFLNLSLKKKA